MSAEVPERPRIRRRRLKPRDMARVSPLPPPQEVFFDWLLGLSPEDDLEDAARRQIELIDARATSHPDVDCLRMLFVGLAGRGAWRPRTVGL